MLSSLSLSLSLFTYIYLIKSGTCWSLPLSRFKLWIEIFSVVSNVSKYCCCLPVECIHWLSLLYIYRSKHKPRKRVSLCGMSLCLSLSLFLFTINVSEYLSVWISHLFGLNTLKVLACILFLFFYLSLGTIILPIRGPQVGSNAHFLAIEYLFYFKTVNDIVYVIFNVYIGIYWIEWCW